MSKRFERFAVGSNWGGLLPPHEWANDFTEMRQAGMNAIRLGLSFPERREPNIAGYDDVARILDLAHAQQLKVLFSLITILVPREFFTRYPDIRFIDIDGQPFPRNIEDLTWPQACFNHPDYRREIERFFGEAVTRFRDHPALLAWTVHNEPCNPWGSTGCYCAHTIAAFRPWLRARYNDDLEALNALWGTAFASWGAVEPPRVLPQAGGNRAAWLDWMTFGEWNVTDFVRWEAELVRALDPTRPIGTNTMGGMLLPITTAQSEKELAQVLDFIGQDWYPSWEFGRRRGEKGQLEKHAAARLDMTRWAVGAKQAIIAEVQAGPNAESIWFSPDEMRIEAWQAVAHGMKGLYYYRWDPLISGAEPWVHHMRTIEGKVTPRVDETGRLARQIASLEELVMASNPVQAPVAILYSRPSKILAEAEGLYNPQYNEAIKGVYRAFTDNHYPVDWIDGDEILAGRLAGYQVLLLPWTYCLERDVAAAIKAWCRQGGILVAEPYCANRDEHGVTYKEAPGAGLAEVFGVQVNAVVNYRYWLVGHAIEMTARGSAITGIAPEARFWLAGLREVVTLAPGAEALLMFSAYSPTQEYSPALVLNRYGAGAALYFCAGMGEAYTKMELPYLQQLIAGLMAHLGVPRPVAVEDLPVELARDLAVSLLQTPDGRERTIVVINHGEQEARPVLCLDIGPGGRYGLRELITYDSLPLERKGALLTIHGCVPGRDVRLYHLYALDEA